MSAQRVHLRDGCRFPRAQDYRLLASPLGLRVDLLDGTYELFRHYFALPPHKDADGVDVAAVRGVLRSVLTMLESDVTHLGVAANL